MTNNNKKINIPKRNQSNTNNKKHYEHLKEKRCKFPGCDQIYFGTGASKFCQKHRQKKYRKIINALNSKKKPPIKIENSNQIIEHNYLENQTVVLTCELENCKEQFELKIIKGIYVYPKYCPKHRNEWKRKMYLKNKKNLLDL